MLLLRSLVAVSKRDFAKARLGSFTAREFFTHLKEIEFSSKVKVRNKNLYKILLKWLRKNPSSF